MQLTMPYWQDTETNNGARMKLAGVVALTLGTTGVRCIAGRSACHIVTRLFNLLLVARCSDPAVGTVPCSVMFNFLGRDFFTALSNKDVDKFTEMLIKWLCALCAGIPVFVFRDYYQVCAKPF
jgi:ABC-type uncharacterized transport system fused permease/ATPase subunit